MNNTKFTSFSNKPVTLDENSLIMAIESSCDETSVSIIKNGFDEIATVVLSQMDIQFNSMKNKHFITSELLVKATSLFETIVYLKEAVQNHQYEIKNLLKTQEEDIQKVAEKMCEEVKKETIKEILKKEDEKQFAMEQIERIHEDEIFNDKK